MSECGPGDWWIDVSCRWCRRREVHVAQLAMYHRGCEERAAARAVVSRPGHAPGWSWRREHAGQLARPWPVDLPSRVSGLCEKGWHGDCPQAPLPDAGPFGECSCSCHRLQPALFDLDTQETT